MTDRVDELSSAQMQVLKWVDQDPDGYFAIAGNGMAPYLQAARALVRKGFLVETDRTAHFIRSQGAQHD